MANQDNQRVVMENNHQAPKILRVIIKSCNMYDAFRAVVDPQATVSKITRPAVEDLTDSGMIEPQIADKIFNDPNATITLKYAGCDVGCDHLNHQFLPEKFTVALSNLPADAEVCIRPETPAATSQLPHESAGSVGRADPGAIPGDTAGFDSMDDATRNAMRNIRQDPEGDSDEDAEDGTTNPQAPITKAQHSAGPALLPLVPTVAVSQPTTMISSPAIGLAESPEGNPVDASAARGPAVPPGGVVRMLEWRTLEAYNLYLRHTSQNPGDQ